jgi:hypothetical protein
LSRLKLFLKANSDVYDALHSCREGGKVVWNGVNAVARSRFPGSSIRLQHEPSAAFLSVLEAHGAPPAETSERAHLLGRYWGTSPYSTAIFETDADAIVLSLHPEIFEPVHRHRRSGQIFYAPDPHRWPRPDQEWLAEHFEPPGPANVEDSMRALEQLHDRIRRSTQAPLLVFNLSAIFPGERIHCFQGLDDMLSTQIRRYNLGLIEASERIGLSIIDVDGVLARAGAERLRIGAFHRTPEGHRLVAEEVVHVLSDLGLLTAEESAS